MGKLGRVLTGAGLAAMLTVAPSLSATAGAQQGGIVVRVKIVDFKFKPKTLTITAGESVEWINRGSAPHTSDANSGAWESGVLTTGESFTQGFPTAGTFRYHCDIHDEMRGTIIVNPPA